MKHSEHPITSIRPRISNTGTTAQRHAYNSDWMLRRPRILGWGPRTISGPSEEFANYSEQAIWWPFVDGDQTTYETLWDIWTPTFGEGSRIEVRASFIGTHLVDDEFYLVDDLEELRQKAAECAWDCKVEAMQFTDGDADWSAATTLDTDNRDTVVATQWPTNHSGKFVFLQQQRWLKFGDTATNYAYVFKEGQLHKSDWAFMTHQNFEVDLGSSHTFDHPVRIKLSAKRQTSFTADYQVGRRGSQQSDAYLRWSLVSVSAVEFPQ